MVAEVRRRKKEIAGTFADLLRSAGDTACWQVTRSLGSWLTFDLGGRVKEKTRQGSVEVGTAILSIRGGYWRVANVGASRINSTSLNEGDLAAVRLAVLGASLDEISADATSLIFRFGAVSFHVDLTNRWSQDEDEEVCLLTLSGSVSLAVYPHGRLQFWLLNSDVEKAA